MRAYAAALKGQKMVKAAFSLHQLVTCNDVSGWTAASLPPPLVAPQQKANAILAAAHVQHHSMRSRSPTSQQKGLNQSYLDLGHESS